MQKNRQKKSIKRKIFLIMSQLPALVALHCFFPEINNTAFLDYLLDIEFFSSIFYFLGKHCGLTVFIFILYEIILFSRPFWREIIEIVWKKT